MIPKRKFNTHNSQEEGTFDALGGHTRKHSGWSGAEEEGETWAKAFTAVFSEGMGEAR